VNKVMKTLLNKENYLEIVERIDQLDSQSIRLWGKMNTAQMLHHCYLGVQSAKGDIVVKRVFISYLIGPMVKHIFLKGKPYQRNSPTGKELIVTEQLELDAERKKLKDILRSFYEAGEAGCSKAPHGFFGKLSPVEWGILQYMHLDHHLRQFSN
jgi:hypothetical protein